MNKHQQKTLSLTLLAGTLVFFTHNTQASALSNNVSGIGNNFAGEAALADDASTEYYNPAGLTFLNRHQFVAGAFCAALSSDFSGAQVTPSNFQQVGTAHSSYPAIVPFLFYSYPLTERVAVGFGMTPTFGYGGTNYGEDSILRYSGTKNILGAFDMSPGFGYKIVDNFSIGAGIDITYLRSVSDTVFPATWDDKILTRASAWGYGWHAGVLWQITPCLRAGYTFHSRIKYNAKGTSEYYTDLGLPQETAYITNDLTYQIVSPANHALTAVFNANNAWTWMGTINLIQWSQIRSIFFQNVSVDPNIPVIGGLVTLGNVTDYRDKWAISLGTNYQFNSKWLFRAGLGYATDYTKIQSRTAQAPNAANYQIAVGLNYAFSNCFSMDVGMQHVIASSVPINIMVASGRQLGDLKLGYNVGGVQFNWNI